MKIVLGARKAAKRSRGRVKGRSVNYKQHYYKYGRQYYVKNRTKILKRAKARYAANKGKYARMRARWLKKTNGGKRPLYLSGKSRGRRPVYPRLKPLHRSGKGSGRIPRKSGRAWAGLRAKARKVAKRSKSALKRWSGKFKKSPTGPKIRRKR